MDIKVKTGCVKVNSIHTKKLSDDVTFVHIDLKAKHAEIDAYTNNGLIIGKREPNDHFSGTLHTEDSNEDTTIEFPEGVNLRNFVISSYSLTGLVSNKDMYEDFDTNGWTVVTPLKDN